MTQTTFEKINPSTEQVLATYPVEDMAIVCRKVNTAHALFPLWHASALLTRCTVLKQIATALYQQADTLARLVSDETGKPLADALEADLGIAINVLHYYAKIAPAVLSPHSVTPDFTTRTTGYHHQITYHARGVIAVISPWNYPLSIAVSGIATALVTGCPVVLKPSELTPGTGIQLVQLIQRVLQQNNLPAELVQCVTGSAETGKALIQSSISGVIFTGSARTGLSIQQKMTERGLWSSIELGGSDAMLVLEESPIEIVSSYAVWGRFLNAGQACASVKRLFVPKKQREAWLRILKAKIEQLNLTQPANSDNQSLHLVEGHMGPLINHSQLTLAQSQVEEAIALGATLVTGGYRVPGSGYFYAPTLLADIPKEARVLHEEVFAPVLPVIFYTSVEQAIEDMNQSAFGLTASVFGPEKKARAIAGQLACGTVSINGNGLCNYAMPSAPWGGWKQSGTGVSHGQAALREISLQQVQSTNRCFVVPGLRKPMWHFSTSTGTAIFRAKALLDCINRQFIHPKHWLTFLKQCFLTSRL
jgi:acyl-CoA reductase-like NAD-dependent aldehyde dehydrogenase